MSKKLQNSQNSMGGGNTEGGSTDRYIRVRTDYYKIVEKPMTDGSIAQLLIKWKYGTIKADHGREFAEETPCYDDFIIFPDNVNPQQVVDGRFWNLYYSSRGSETRASPLSCTSFICGSATM